MDCLFASVHADDDVDTADTLKELCKDSRLKLTMLHDGVQLKRLIPAKGLWNVGNTCFTNAAMQLLLACPPIWNTLIEAWKSGVCSGRMDKDTGKTVIAFTSFLQSYLKSTSTSPPVRLTDFLPLTFMYDLAGASLGERDMRPGRQEDASEWLLMALTILKPISGVNFTVKYNSRRACSSCRNKLLDKDTYETYIALTIPSEQQRDPTSTQDLFLRPLPAEATDTCHECRKNGTIITTETIAADPPQCLFLYLNRTATQRKFKGAAMPYRIQTPVEASPKLHFDFNDNEAQKRAEYDLVGIVDHQPFGRATQSGHYIAHREDESGGAWKTINDAIVTNCGALQPTHHTMFTYRRKS